MNAGLIDRIETSTERLASASFGVAVGYAAYVGLSALVSLPELAVCAVAAAIVAHLLSGRTLKVFSNRGPKYKIAVFDVREIEPIEDELLLTSADQLDPSELVLTEADRVDPGELVLTNADRLPADAEQMLVLDDVLAELGPESRVVRLFDRKAMPTPGQLKSRIDDHLGQGMSPAAQSDASQALSDALAELRRSLR